MVAPLATLLINASRLPFYAAEVTAALNVLKNRGLIMVTMKDLMDALKSLGYWSSSIANYFGTICEQIKI